MWVMICETCGVVGTLFEKPGTGCKYVRGFSLEKLLHRSGSSQKNREVRYCMYCSSHRVRDERVESYEELQRVKAREADKQRA